MKLHINEFVSEILDKFEKKGYEIYIVGGAVRDELTGRPVDDWDFTTNATPEEIQKIFPDGFYDNIFGTVGISHPSSKNPYEITTFRREYGYSDTRRPDKVDWGNGANPLRKTWDVVTSPLMPWQSKKQAGNLNW